MSRQARFIYVTLILAAIAAFSLTFTSVSAAVVANSPYSAMFAPTFDGQCPVMDPSDIWGIHTCLRAVSSTSIPVLTTRAFYFETYVETGYFFFFNDSYTVTTVGGKAQISTSEFGQYANYITLPIYRDHFSGYARSPNFYVKGNSVGPDSLWAYTYISNDGNTLSINITSPPAPRIIFTRPVKWRPAFYPATRLHLPHHARSRSLHRHSRLQ